MTTYVVGPAGPLSGVIEVPGDKSISHRAVILGSLAYGKTTIQGLLEATDVLSTISAFQAMGVSIHQRSENNCQIIGVGLRGLKAPRSNLDLRNSGTSMRLLCGVLAGQNFRSTLTGDQSLRARPMERITTPLEQMGASIRVSAGGVAPLDIKPVTQLNGIDYRIPIASAQVKSAILLAGLYARNRTIVREEIPTRDHTERMLEGFGYPVVRRTGRTVLPPGKVLHAADLKIPGDFSSAAFFLVAACVVPGSRIQVNGVGMNPTRTGLLDILHLMGAKIEVNNHRTVAGEPVADLVAESSDLCGVDVPLTLVPRTIDEFPVLSIAAAHAQGVTRISGAEELRFKESDRIATVVTALRSLGISANEQSDGMVIRGGVFREGTIDSGKDHRVAMAFAVAGAGAEGVVRILNCANVVTSFPDFSKCSRRIGIKIQEEKTG
jgi:3-phosphoshikimate 1-carboxyvinyltransferase